MRKPYRILSLSGGGVRGIFQARFLSKLQQLTQRPLRDSFDLVAGTSTGSISALAVALGKDIEGVAKLFEDHAATVFHRRAAAGIRCGPRYNQTALRRQLEGLFANAQLRDAKPKGPDVLVAASCLDRFAHRVFSTLRDTTGAGDEVISAVETALASCAAPTYFAPVTPSGEKRSYLDGGLWANSPSLAAVLLAHLWRGVPFETMRVLSVGTGRVPMGTSARKATALRPWSFGTVRLVLELTFAAQASSTDELTKAVLPRHAFLSVSPDLDKEISLDDVDLALGLLPALADQAAQDNLSEVKRLIDARLGPAHAQQLSPHLLRAIREAYCRALGANSQERVQVRVNLMALDPDATQYLRIFCCDHESDYEPREFNDRWRTDEGRCGMAWTTGQQLYYGKGLPGRDGDLNRMASKSNTASSLASVLSTPVRLDGQTQGVVNLDSTAMPAQTKVDQEHFRQLVSTTVDKLAPTLVAAIREGPSVPCA